MKTLSLAALVGVAKANGYAGDPLDGKAAQSHLLALKNDAGEPDPITEVTDLEGDTHDVKSWTPPVKAKGRTAAVVASAVMAAAGAGLNADQIPADLVDKIKSQVVAEMVAKGVISINRPGNPAGAAVTVKSGPEREYEDRIKHGQAIFSSHSDALDYVDMVRTKYLFAIGKYDEALKVRGKQAERMSQKGYTITDEASGAALVPEGYDANLIRLVKNYGMARQAARLVNMTSDVITRPKVTSTGGLTVYYPNDGGTATESTETWGRVTMKAKQGVVMVKMSRALLDDSAINQIEDTTREAARAIAKIEDNSLFNGDNSVSGSYIPQVQGLTNLIADTATGSRTLKSASTTAAGTTLKELTSFMGLLPSFARNQNTAFHCTPEMMNIILTQLAQTQGGVTYREFADYGFEVPFVFGRPVILNNVMPNNNSTTANRVNILFGDISLAADFGSRKGVEIDISDQRFWDSVNIALRAVVRHDINCHDVGSSTVQSPVVALTQT